MSMPNTWKVNVSKDEYQLVRNREVRNKVILNKPDVLSLYCRHVFLL